MIEVPFGLDGDVEPWGDGAAGQAQLSRVPDEARLARGLVAAHCGAEVVCDLAQLVHAVADPGACGDDDVRFVEVERARVRASINQAGGRSRKSLEGKVPHFAVAVAWVERLEHPRPHGRELRRRRTHDHRDDVAPVGRLELDQAPGAVDPKVDAVAGHAELELARGTRAIVAAPARRGDQQDVRPLAPEHLRQRARPDDRLVLGQSSVVRDDDFFRAVARNLARRVVEPLPEQQRDVLATELACELPPLREELERDARGPALDQLDERPGVVRGARLLAQALGFLP